MDGIGATQTRTLATAAEWAADMVSVMTEADVAADQIELVVNLGLRLEGGVVAAREALQAASRAQAEADAAENGAVRALADLGLGAGDIAALTGVARGRVSRLTGRQPR